MKSAAKVVVLLALLGVLAHAQPVAGQFHHVIIAVQENRTPDNLFGGVPGSNGLPPFEPGVDLAQAPNAQPWCLGACFDPGHENSAWQNQWSSGVPGKSPNPGLCGGTGPNGRVTTCNAQPVCNGNGNANWKGCSQTNPLNLPAWPEESYVSYSYDPDPQGNPLISPYVSIATNYGFANYFYQTNQGPSQPAHDFLFGGTSAPNGVTSQTYYNYFAADNPKGASGTTGCEAPSGQYVPTVDSTGAISSYQAYPCLEHLTLVDLLQSASPQLTWAYYTNDLGDIWTAPNGISHICVPVQQPDGSEKCTGSAFTGSRGQNPNVLTPPNAFFQDFTVGGTNLPGGDQNKHCTIPNVTWIIPNGNNSDHPGLSSGNSSSTAIEGGPNWVADVVNAVGNATCTDEYGEYPWYDTVIFIVWDDWGGWYDHVGAGFQDNDFIDNMSSTPCIPEYQSLFWGCGYTYGFRVPFLVVSAYTQDGTVSGACGTQNTPACGPLSNTDPHRQDFGSILAFIEYNFDLEEGGINMANGFPFADYYAPELQYDRATGAQAVPLGDFFNLTTAKTFEPITTVNNSFTFDYFYNYSGPPVDPDNDVIDND